MLTVLLLLGLYLFIGSVIGVTSYILDAFFDTNLYPKSDIEWTGVITLWPILLLIIIIVEGGSILYHFICKNTSKVTVNFFNFIDNKASQYKEHKLNRYKIDPNIVNEFKVK